MKFLIKYKLNGFFLAMTMLLVFACNDPLEVTPKSQLAPGNFLATSNGITSVLNSGYANLGGRLRGIDLVEINEWTTDEMWETGGGANRRASLYINFTWSSSQGLLMDLWNGLYRAIRDANIVLDNISNTKMEDSEKELVRAQARFIRATAYDYLYYHFGAIPLVTSSNQDKIKTARAPEDKLKDFIEKEYVAIADKLPAERSVEETGRATKGAALGLLTKFYLNTKQWSKAAKTAEDIMNMGIYELSPDYFELFHVKNEHNKEFIFQIPSLASGPGNGFMAAQYPANYPVVGSGVIFAHNDRLYDSFVNSFDPNDDRLNLIITEYTDTDGNHIQLLGNDNSRAFKYWPDPNTQGNSAGNDVPVIRYSDILLSRAEALNELNGPNQTSINLINKVRERAGVSDWRVSDFSSKKELRSHILKERGREFYLEGKRRMDLIRQGKFIEKANERGVKAQSYQVLFPIPQSEIDANPNLDQTSGY